MSSASRPPRFGLRAIIALLMSALALQWTIHEAAAQQATVRSAVVFVEGDRQEDALEYNPPLPAQDVRSRVLEQLQRGGYLHAAIDSVRQERTSVLEVHVDQGPLVRLRRVEVTGDSSGVPEAFYRISGLAPGDPLDIARLERGIEAMLHELVFDGHALASIRLNHVEFVGDALDEAVVHLLVDRGGEAILREVRLSGADRTSARYATRLLRLEPGDRLQRFDAPEVRRRLMDSGLFRAVGMPRLLVVADSVILLIPVTEEPPGSFDLAFGYQPTAAGGSVVGSGSLELLNPFGGGRSFALNLDRLPGQTSRLSATAADPYLFGLPLRGAASFSGYQQDSLFHRQRIGGEVGYAFAQGLDVFGTAARESSRPGTAGVRLEGGRQRIARSDVTMIGAGVRFLRIDYVRNPARGLMLEAVAERGTNRRLQTRLVDADTVREQRAVRHDRLTLALRTYLPVSGRGVVVAGGDLRTLISDEYDRSDFFRIGGLRTLRGYDDDRFLARLASRGLLEYRFLLDRLSHLLAFVDVAYVERPELHDIEGFASWQVGYGVGAQFDTGFSVMNVALAANPQDGLASPRIHAGVSFGL